MSITYNEDIPYSSSGHTYNGAEITVTGTVDLTEENTHSVEIELE